MMTVYLFGVALAVFVSCPDWPWFNSNPEVFLPVQVVQEVSNKKESTESKDSKKKVNKK